MGLCAFCFVFVSACLVLNLDCGIFCGLVALTCNYFGCFGNCGLFGDVIRQVFGGCALCGFSFLVVVFGILVDLVF